MAHSPAPAALALADLAPVEARPACTAAESDLCPAVDACRLIRERGVANYPATDYGPNSSSEALIRLLLCYYSSLVFIREISIFSIHDYFRLGIRATLPSSDYIPLAGCLCCACPLCEFHEDLPYCMFDLEYQINLFYILFLMLIFIFN